MSQKNSFFNFIVSCIPGAGQMYQGFVKKGLSIMFSFVFVMAAAEFLQIFVIWYFLPVIWLYAFFDSLNTNSLPKEKFEMLEDQFLFTGDDIRFVLPKSKSFVNICGIFFVFAGAYAILDEILDIFARYFGYEAVARIRILMEYIPRFLFSAAILAAGIWMMTQKKQELEKEVIALEDKENKE